MKELEPGYMLIEMHRVCKESSGIGREIKEKTGKDKVKE